MWPRPLTLWFSFKFWIYVESDILTLFGPHFRANIDSETYKSWIWITYFRQSHSINGNWKWISTLWFKSNSWTIQYKLDLNHFHEFVIGSRIFHFRVHIITFHQITFICWIKVLTNLTLRWFTNIGHLIGMSFTIRSYMILFKFRVIIMLTG